MAMQPMDLQMLFSQLDTISKDVAAQKDGLVLKQAINGLQIEKANEIKNKSVHEAQENEEGLEKLKDKKNRNSPNANDQHDKEKQAASGAAEAAKKHQGLFKDPDLGNYVDISG
jgi:hypothetical protein